MTRYLFITLLLLCGFSLAGADPAPAAQPGQTAEQIAANPQAALNLLGAQVQALLAAWESAKAVGFWSAIGAAFLGGLALLIGIGKNLPGIGGMAAGAANVLWRWFSPKSAQRADDAAQVQAQGFKFLVQQIEGLGPDSTLGQLKERLARKMPESVKNAVSEYLRETPDHPVPMKLVTLAQPAT